MILEERFLPPRLQAIARRVWYLQTTPLGRFEKILPLPFAHLIVNLSEPYRLYDRSGVATRVADAFVSGLQAEFLVIESPPVIRHVGLEFTPAGLHALVPGAGAAAARRVQDARAVLTDVDELVERVRTATGPAEMMARMEGLLGRVEPVDPVVTGALEELEDEPEVAMAALAGRLGVSHGTLIARFRAVTGVTPKQHAQVLRFHRFVSAVHEAGGTPDWAALAVGAGYYDQPHVIRAFRRFSGWTPMEYYRLVAVHGPLAAHFVPLDQVPLTDDCPQASS